MKNTAKYQLIQSKNGSPCKLTPALICRDYPKNKLNISEWPSIFIIALLSGCSNTPPTCVDSNATDLVIQIVNEQAEQIKRGFDIKDDYEAKIKDIRTIGKNAETGSFQCAATIEVNSDSIYLKRNNKSITYTTEITEDNGKAFVTVYGLK